MKNDHLTNPFCTFGCNILGVFKVRHSGNSLAPYPAEFRVTHCELGSFIRFQSLQPLSAIKCDQDDGSKAINVYEIALFFLH